MQEEDCGNSDSIYSEESALSQIPFVTCTHCSKHADTLPSMQCHTTVLCLGFRKHSSTVHNISAADLNHVQPAFCMHSPNGCIVLAAQCIRSLNSMQLDVELHMYSPTSNADYMSMTVAVLCVMGGTTQKPQDVYGEAALLLDTIDLVLHSAAVSSATAAAAPAPAPAAAAVAILPDSDQMVQDDPSSSVHDQQQQPAHSHENSDKPWSARQPALQRQGYGESVLWGLRAVAAMAKQDSLVQHCAHMLTDYILERIVLLSREWPVEVGQAAAAVSMSQ